MTTRREAALRKLEGPMPRRYIRMRWFLVRLILSLFMAIASFILGLLPVLLMGCIGEDPDCILMLWSSNGSVLDGKPLTNVYLVVLLIGMLFGIMVAFICTDWVVERTNIITKEELEELMRPKGRHGLWGLFRKKKLPPDITRHEMRNVNKQK